MSNYVGVESVSGGMDEIGASYDTKRDLLWSYVPVGNDANGWRATQITSVYANGTDFKVFDVKSVEDGTSFILCHYSEYYDIYSCLCNDFDHFDPNTQQQHYIGPLVTYESIIFALMDNGKKAVFIDYYVFAIDVMNKSSFRQVGKLNLPDDMYAGANPILIGFTG